MNNKYNIVMRGTEQAQREAYDIVAEIQYNQIVEFPGLAEMGLQDDAFAAEAIIRAIEAIRNANGTEWGFEGTAAFGRLEMLVRFNLTNIAEIRNAIQKFTVGE